MSLDEMLDAAADDVPAASAHEDWLVLTRPGGATRDTAEPRLRRALTQLAVIAVVVIGLVAFVGGLISRRLAESQSVHEVARLTNVLADSVVQPALTERVETDPRAAARFDALVRSRVLSDSLVRVKIWTTTGRIVYSDERRLIGTTFGLDTGARAAFSDPQVRAEISDLSAPENRYERGQGPLLEVYRPVWTAGGTPLLFETYFRYDQVSERSAQLWHGFAGILLSSIAAIVVLLIPVVWSLVARARRAHRQREQMLRRAMEASLDERRRIAATLHDGVVQELAAAAFAVSGGAQEAAAHGDEALARRLREAGDVVRSGIGGMRSLLVDIYPPNLRTAGLAPALRDLAATVRVPVEVTVDEHAASALTPERQQAVFRITQECLRNASAHAQASAVTVHVSSVEGATELEIADDGVGFDPRAQRATGHFGLSLMADLARENDAELAVLTAPASPTYRGGTRWRLLLPR